MNTTQDLKILVVEDNEVAIRNYQVRFRSMGLAMPQFVTSFNDAENVLRSAESFDLVILDLSIPEDSRLPGAVNNGFMLLQQCIKRDENPIPGLVIRTGKLAKTDQTVERVKLEKEFACGRLVLKSMGNISEEITPAIEQILAFNRKETNGDNVSLRERYLVRRLALKLEYRGFHLSLQSKEQYAHLQRSPFMEDGAKLFMGEPILESGMESPHRYYLAFMEGDGHRLDAAFDQAKQWAETCPHVSRPDRFQSNRFALLCFQVVAPVQSINDEKTKVERRARVCDLIFACINDRSRVTSLAADLARYDRAFERLDEDSIRKFLAPCKPNERSWVAVARISMHVGAFDDKQDEALTDTVAARFRAPYYQHNADRCKNGA